MINPVCYYSGLCLIHAGSLELALSPSLLGIKDEQKTYSRNALKVPTLGHQFSRTVLRYQGSSPQANKSPIMVGYIKDRYFRRKTNYVVVHYKVLQKAVQYIL